MIEGRVDDDLDLDPVVALHRSSTLGERRTAEHRPRTGSSSGSGWVPREREQVR
jgi:hypothetical protein